MAEEPVAEEAAAEEVGEMHPDVEPMVNDINKYFDKKDEWSDEEKMEYWDGTFYRISKLLERKIYAPDEDVLPGIEIGQLKPLREAMCEVSEDTLRVVKPFSIDGIPTLVRKEDETDEEKMARAKRELWVGRQVAIEYNLDDGYELILSSGKSGGRIKKVVRLLSYDGKVFGNDRDFDDHIEVYDNHTMMLWHVPLETDGDENYKPLEEKYKLLDITKPPEPPLKKRKPTPEERKSRIKYKE